ncbi:MAG: DUF1109 domain-containing protein [Proteobacteria bacterium]|nr:DUF1109 domain-containing protein [Pseudomonadota bacterium]
MQTDDLIAHLTGELEPVRGAEVVRILAAGLALGLLGSALLMAVTIGIRPDIIQAMGGSAFWLKFTYTLVIAILGLKLVERMGRPGTDASWPALLLAVPVVTLMSMMAMQMMPADSATRHALLMGHSADVCSVLIAGLALPLFAGLFWALRRLAPTRLTEAGAAAGLLAGSAAATIYAFHCTESTATFIAIWYTAGIALTTLMGAGLGRFLLRW